MSVVYFGRGKRLHIETNGGTLCGKPLPRGAVVLDECPDNGKFCRVCMAEVGEESLGSYLGIEALTGKTLRKLLKEAG